MLEVTNRHKCQLDFEPRRPIDWLVCTLDASHMYWLKHKDREARLRAFLDAGLLVGEAKRLAEMSR